MQIQELVLKNFRNFKTLRMKFCSGVNVITGPNGAGKTNILESLYLCSIGRSPKTKRDATLVTYGEEAYKVDLMYKVYKSERSVGVEYVNNKKQVTLCGNTTRVVSEIVGNFVCVYFSSDEIELISGYPQSRRKFMDITNCQINPTYLADLKKFTQLDKQRSALLSQELKKTYDLTVYEPWDRQIAELSFKITKVRKSFVEKLQALLDKIMPNLTDEAETLRLTYKTMCNFDGNFISEYLQKVRQNFFKDVTRKNSTFGIKFDDICIELGIQSLDGYKYINLREDGSLGQKRTATLALKIAEVYLYSEHFGENPVLLLDDVFAELDKKRRTKLLEFCKNFNTVITCTEWEEGNYGCVFGVKDSNVHVISKNES